MTDALQQHPCAEVGSRRARPRVDLAPRIMAAPSARSVADLTFPEVSGRLRESSVLCLPIGAIEQHGAHLPLNTDVIVAEELTRRIIARWGDEFDLWQLPTVSVSLSREHDWAPGTLALTIQSFVGLLRDMARDIARALPARNLLIVNGHGGNRGVLDNLIHELRGDFALNACVIHPFDLSKAETGARSSRCSRRQERDLGDAGAGAAAGARADDRACGQSAR